MLSPSLRSLSGELPGQLTLILTLTLTLRAAWPVFCGLALHGCGSKEAPTLTGFLEALQLHTALLAHPQHPVSRPQVQHLPPETKRKQHHKHAGSHSWLVVGSNAKTSPEH